MSLSIILDITMIVMLFSVMVVAIILSRKLSFLYKRKEEIHHFMQVLAHSLVEAKNTLDKLEVISSQNSQELQDKIRLVKALRRDLEISIANAEKITTPSKPSSQPRSSSVPAAQRMSQPAASIPGVIKATSQQRVEPKLIQALRELS